MAEVTAVQLKFPQFWQTSAKVWFALTETQFGVRGITADIRRYNYVVAALDETAANRMEHVILRPPTYDKYEHLKAALYPAMT